MAEVEVEEDGRGGGGGGQGALEKEATLSLWGGDSGSTERVGGLFSSSFDVLCV